MNSLQSKAVTQYIDSRDWPKTLHYTVADAGFSLSETEHAQWLQFILYRSNINTFSGEDMMRIASIVQEMFMKLRNDGVPIYLEVKP